MQQVHINRLGVNSIEFETAVLDIPLVPGGEHSFELVIINYGSPTHVHLSVDPPLEDYVTFLDDNPYVTHEEYVPVVVRIPYDGRLYSTGNVFVTVGYGSKKDSFTIRIGSESPRRVMTEEEAARSSHVTSVSPVSDRSSSPSLSDVMGMPFQTVDMRKLFVVITAIIFLIAAYLLLSSIPTFLGESDISIGFYSSVFLSVIFTVAVAYLLVRLPLIKR